jgi:DNA-binding HxlR family transcriptional regulator
MQSSKAQKAKTRIEPRSVTATNVPEASGARTAVDFDPLIHERMRLGIISALAVNESLTFNDLKQLLKTTDGNLSVHARRLEEDEFITCTKSFDGRTPRTEYRITTSGRRALQAYLTQMEKLIETTRK